MQQDLVAPVLLHGHLEQLGVLQANAAEGQIAAKQLDVAVGEGSRVCEFI